VTLVNAKAAEVGRKYYLGGFRRTCKELTRNTVRGRCLTASNGRVGRRGLLKLGRVSFVSSARLRMRWRERRVD
jgi:hypothetical protein